ncbi:MAG: sterol desaturase family protein [Ilumatobacteraceae bacterium]
MADLSVAVTPLYVASMAVEKKVLDRRAAAEGPSPATYERPDTATSLAMGALSLTTPLTASLVGMAALRRGRAGRIGRVVAGVAVAAAAVTTVADIVERRAGRRLREGALGDAGRRTMRQARQVAAVGGVVAVAAGGVVVCATAAALGSATRHWQRGQRRDLGSGVVPFTAAMVGWDLGYYANHRLMHEVRALWAVHVPHHSSEHYNLSTALRQPVTHALGVWLPYGLMSRVGIRPRLIETARALNLIYQYWIHTDTIRSLGRAEAVLNTPSHHRVHHGSNGRYLDRNHGGILIVWDRLFGTYQPERADDPVVYGLTENLGTYNLLSVIGHEYRAIARDIARSRTWRDRLGFVLRSPRWGYARRAELDAADAAAVDADVDADRRLVGASAIDTTSRPA